MRETVVQRIHVEPGFVIPCRDSFGMATTLRIGDGDDYEVVVVVDSGPGWADIERDAAPPSTPSLANDAMGPEKPGGEGEWVCPNCGGANIEDYGTWCYCPGCHFSAVIVSNPNLESLETPPKGALPDS
jgi:hypothetical protein